LTRVTEAPAGGGVCFENISCRIMHENGVVNRLEKRAPPVARDIRLNVSQGRRDGGHEPGLLSFLELLFQPSLIFWAEWRPRGLVIINIGIVLGASVNGIHQRLGWD